VRASIRHLYHIDLLDEKGPSIFRGHLSEGVRPHFEFSKHRLVELWTAAAGV